MKIMDDHQECLKAAMRLLARRDHSRAELSQKLANRSYSADQIAWTLDECRRLAYLDDTRFADEQTRRLRRKGYGCRRIRQMLLTKGVSHDIVEESIDDCCRQEIQLMDCRQTISKKLHRTRGIEDSAAAKARLYRFLINRGFSPDIIRMVMDGGLNQGE